MKVLLVDMPFASASRPALGLGLLKSELAEAGFSCDLICPKVDFARRLGVARYQRIAVELPQTLLAGEWVFTGCLYPDGEGPRAGFVQDVLERYWLLPPADVDAVLAAREAAPTFLEECFDAVPWARYAVAGFTSCGAQNVAALALARRVKRAYPEITIIFGGSNWEEGMGRELHRQFPFVDIAVSGEADETFPELVRRLDSDGAEARLDDIPGLSYRRAGQRLWTGSPLEFPSLDELPSPDLSSYFSAIEDVGIADEVAPAALVETSRGCWWAAAGRACRFCGTPGTRRPYRAKSAERALTEIRTVAGASRCQLLELADDVPPPEFFTLVLPRLAEEPLPIPFFCETRPGVTREQIHHLAATGASIQPGIESLSDHVLRLLRKGATALGNIRLLKWCRAEGVTPHWNLIYGVPGETREDYEEMAALLPALRFLQPPGGFGPVRLDRHCAYAMEPEKYGLGHLASLVPYRYLYPFPEESLARFAFAFESEAVAAEGRDAPVETVSAAVQRWQSEPDSGEVRFASSHDREARDGAGVRKLLDSRSDAVASERSLDTLEWLLYAACEDIAGRARLGALAARVCPRRRDLDAAVDEILEAFVADRLMVRSGDRYLSLALPST